MLSNILLSRLTPYVDEIIQDHQCGFGCMKSQVTNHHIHCIRQILERRREYNEAVHQPCIDLKKAYDSVRKQITMK
jgi:hypothetical protein